LPPRLTTVEKAKGWSRYAKFRKPLASSAEKTALALAIKLLSLLGEPADSS
jgi:hypothetical protein